MSSLPNRISTRLSDKDYRKVTNISNRLGRSKAVVLRAIINGYNHHDKGTLSLDNYTKLYKAMDKLNNLYRVAYRDGNNLNQIARMENRSGFSSYSPDLIRKADYDFKAMYSLLRKVVTYGAVRNRSQP